MTLPQTQIAWPGWVTAQDPQDWLTPDEHAVFDGWRSDKRRSEWLAGRLAAKKLIQAEFGLEPQAWAVGRDGVAPCIDAGGRLPEFVLSLSHSGGLGAATVSHRWDEGSVGVDIQQIRPVHAGLSARVFTDGERRQVAARFGSEGSAEGMLLLWALKEAAIKARRRPWGRSLRHAVVRLGDSGCAEVMLEGVQVLTARYARLGEEPGGWWLARAVFGR